jgi:predicted metalloprotease
MHQALKAALVAVTIIAPVREALSAAITVHAPDAEGRVFVDLVGTINDEDFKTFKEKTDQIYPIGAGHTNKQMIVTLVSYGGHIGPALQIGEHIRKRGMSTFVPGDRTCASACALIWLAGKQRTVGDTPQIGFHASYDPSTRRETGAGNAVVGAYLRDLGIDYKAIVFMTRASPTSVEWLTPDLAKQYGVAWALLQPPRAISIPPQPMLQPRLYLVPPSQVIAAWKAWSKSARSLAPQQLLTAPGARHTGNAQDDMGAFVSRVLSSTELLWKQIFASDGRTYRTPIPVLYVGVTQADCGGVAQSPMGPFYCPGDEKVYLDSSFCDLSSKSCGLAQAYVIAHEVGHHVQNLLGILPKAQQAQRASGSKAGANQIQVQVELQADCLAGVWAHEQNQYLRSQGKPPFIEPADVEAALGTAAAIGNDMLHRTAQGYVVPDSFTHGSSDQRQRWFNAGFQSGKVGSCNTFAAGRIEPGTQQALATQGQPTP